MNKMLVAIFNNEIAADAGLQALRRLHAAGDITLYASSVIAKDSKGEVAVSKPMDPRPAGAATGLAVGSLIGLLGGPLGLAIGGATGTAVGAVRDFWVAGVGLDFIEEANKHLQPGKVALVAEIEEEWVVPLDAVLEDAGGHVFRRIRDEAAEAQFDHDIAAFKSEIKALESEAAQAGGAAKIKLQAKLAGAKIGLGRAVRRAQEQVDALKLEAEIKAQSLKIQLAQTTGDVKAKLEERMKRMNSAYHARGAKLARAWDLTKEALSV